MLIFLLFEVYYSLKNPQYNFSILYLLSKNKIMYLIVIYIH